ncbi:MAG: prepilin-type N-terminal cleavage/methylation domain-containing protein [Planctomycetaceae bacterium]|nr:prepilin-type N-terminal cleavage/methylation domain-containing protein [Planctomycetaceae bacterium]
MKHVVRPAGGCRSGFTLIELLLVVALMTVFTAVAWPSIQRYQAIQQADEAAHLLRQELLAARVTAIREVERQTLHARCGTGEYRLGTGEGLPGQLEHGFLFMQAGTRHGDWFAPVSFQPDGTAVNAEFEIQAPDGDVRCLRCDRLTGSIRIAQPEKGEPGK